MNNIGKKQGIYFEDNNSCLVFKEGNDNYKIFYSNKEFKITINGINVSLENFINNYSHVLSYIECYFLNDIIKNYVANNNIIEFSNKLIFIKELLSRRINNDKVIEFLKQIIINYKSFLKNNDNYITNVKFFISNIVPIFIEQLQYKYNKTDITLFIKDLLINNDINFQSKVIEGLINYTDKNIDKNFSNDLLNIDLSKFSLEEIVRLYSILSRQNANKKVVAILNKINEEYISKLNNKETNNFSKLFCKYVSDINFFEEKSNINVANYSQCLVNYFNYISNNKNYKCFKELLNAIREKIIDVDFGKFKLNDKIEESLIEQTTKSIKSKKQKENLDSFFSEKNKKYRYNVVSSLTDSVFHDGIDSQASMKLMIKTSSKAFNKSIKDKVKNVNFSNDRKNRVILNNKQTLSELSKVKSFRREFLNEDFIIDFLNNEKIGIQDKKFLLDFYTENILFKNKKLSKNKLVSFFQKKSRTSKVKKLKDRITNEKKLDNYLGCTIIKLLQEKEQNISNNKKILKKVYNSRNSGFIIKI